MKNFTGKYGCAKIGGGETPTTLHVTGWSVEPSASEHRTDNTGDQGYSSRITGIKDCTFTIEANWDASACPMDDPPNLVPGAELTNLELYFDDPTVTDVAKIAFPKAIVLAVPITSKVDDTTKYTIRGANNGPFTLPDKDFTPKE